MDKKIITEFDKKTNLIKTKGQPKVLDNKVTALDDTESPQLYRGLFDFDRVPLIAFDGECVPMEMPKDIWITDTTFRDGQQSMAPFETGQVVDLFRLMSKLGGAKGIIKQSEFFPYTDRERECIIKCRELGLEFPEITTWIRASEKDFELIKSLEVAETGILTSCSDYHIFNKLGLSRKQAMDKYLGIVRKCIESGIKPRCHLEDITRADIFGFVLPYVTELMKISQETGVPIKIRACDTMGYGVNITGAALPRSVGKLIYVLRHHCGVPSELIEWHGHDDFYRVVTNATAAWTSGCSSINCSLLGIGERTGNCPTEAMCIEYAQLRGTTDGMDLTVITEIAEYFSNEIGYNIPPRTPFVGSAFNTTRAGIHADGLLKDEEIYNIFDTKKILGVAPNVSINDTSGHAGIAYWINAHYHLSDDMAVKKNCELVDKVYSMVMQKYADGRNTVMNDQELDWIVKKADKAQHKAWSKRL